MSDLKDFVIEDGILKKYVGTDENVIIPDGVTAIGDFAFRLCEKLTSVTIPESVTKIGAYSFNGCKNLTSLKIPEGVTVIESETFSDCKNLTSVAVPDGVTAIGKSAFSGCEKLTSITIPDGVTEIGAWAFYGCEKLTSITIPDGVTAIAESTFSRCRNLKSVTIPDSVTRIGTWAFYECKNLTSVIIPKGVTKIDNEAFKFCSQLNITLNGRLELVVPIFEGVSSITSPQIPISDFFTAEEKRAAMRSYFNNMSLYADSEIAEGYRKYAISQRTKLLPDIIKTDNSDALAFYAENKKITAKNFDEEYLNPATEKNATQCIAYLLEWKNKNITSDDIEKNFKKELNKDPYNVTAMKKLWSYKARTDGTICITGYKGNEKEIVIPERIGKNAVTKLSDRAFDVAQTENGRGRPEKISNALSEITSIIIPDGTKEIGKYAFRFCRKLKSVIIPDSVTEIGNGAFDYCENLISVTLPGGITIIRYSMFSGCKKLTSVIIPKGVAKIESFAFNRCENLTSVIIPEGVAKIDSNAFNICEKLTSITIPESAMEIGNFAFWGCPNLTIYAPAGSYAEKYAKENNISFVAEE